MSKTSVQQILSILPDDRPITAIQIVENLTKCPRGFTPISRTYDQDQDADLKESSIFRSGSTRYLCFSKTEGIPNFVIQELSVLRDNNNPTKGYSVLNRAVDSNQKAWKKKQLCYRLVNRKDIAEAVTDIIVCSQLKKAPEGFRFAGEINGITICYKMGNTQDTLAHPDGRSQQPGIPSMSSNPMYPTLSGDGGNDHDYEILRPPGYPAVPSRPAPPRPPAPSLPHQSSTQTLGGVHHSLDGVPFVINPKFDNSSTSERFQVPVVRLKTRQQILNEYTYPFTVERQT